MTNLNLIISLSNIFVGVLTIAVCVPLLKDKVKMNRWYGIRFKQSFESEENWYKINRYGAQRMVLWSVVIVVIGILTLFIPVGNKVSLILIESCVPIILLVPAIESWFYAKRL